MPILLPNNTVAVYWKELVPEYWSCYRSLKRRIDLDDKKGYGIEVIQKGLGQNNRLLINYDTLPGRCKQQIPDPRIPDHILESFYKTDMKAVRYYNDYQYPDGSYLLPETIEELVINASVLTALVQLESARKTERLTKGGSIRGVVTTLYSDAHSFNAWLLKNKNAEHTLNTSIKRFKQQYSDFKNQSYYGIIRDPEGKSKRNALKRTDKTNQLLRNLFAGRKHKPSLTEVAGEYEAFLAGYIEIINKETGELYDPKDYNAISTRTITAFLSTWDSKIGTDAKRSGSNRQPLINKYLPSHKFEMPTLAGSMISIDDRQPPFHYDQNGSRMWWYLGFDLASQAIVAWAYGKSKKELILNFYKNMVDNHNKWNCRLPAEVECESSLNSSYTDSFLQDGAMFEHVTMFRNNARSKRVERFFRELRYSPEFEKSRAGWIGRPFAKDEANQEGPNQKVIIPYDVLVKQCLQDIAIWNNTPKKGLKISRFDYYLQNQNPNLASTNYKSFIKELGTSRRTSCKAGIVTLNSQSWLLGDKGSIYTGEKLINLLKQVERKNIQVYFLDSKKSVIKAFVYDINDDRYICELLPQPVYNKAKIEKTEADLKDAALMSAYTNTVAIYQRNQKNTIDDVQVINNQVTTVSNSFKIDEIDTFEIDSEIPNLPVSPPEADQLEPMEIDINFYNDPSDTL